MTITGHDVVAVALRTLQISGVHYGSFDCADRCQPNLWPHCMDCSGFTSYVLNSLGVGDGCEGSFAQSRRCHAAGTGLNIEIALGTPGAMLFQGVNEGQGGTPGVDPGHVGFALGDGEHSLEARGHWSGVGMFYARSLVWQYAAMPPGVSRASAPSPKPLPNPSPVTPLGGIHMGMIALPAQPATLKGRVPTARAVPGFNFVLLEDGGRLKGDVPVKAGDPQRHWWAPPKEHQIPGWQIIDVADMRPHLNALAVRYAYPNGDSGTYIAEIA